MEMRKKMDEHGEKVVDSMGRRMCHGTYLLS